MPVTVRPAVAEDAPAITALSLELNTHQGDPIEHFTLDAVLRDGFDADPQFHVLLAELDGTPVGYALLTTAYETSFAARGLYLVDILVTASARQHGVGRALMAASAAEAKRRGTTFLWWVSKAWNTDAQAFYRALGAIEEPVVAHALVTERFEELAAEGERAAATVPPRR